MFGLVDALNGIDLRVDIGVIHFAITRDTGRLSFHTPAGVIFTQQVRFDAAAYGGILNGYVDVSAQQVKIGVVNGGTILVSTEQGVKKIFSGKQVAISTVEPIKDKGAYQTVENRDPFYGEAENVDVIPADYFAGEGVGLLGSPVDLNPIER